MFSQIFKPLSQPFNVLKQGKFKDKRRDTIICQLLKVTLLFSSPLGGYQFCDFHLIILEVNNTS